jgi:ABC-2 type transport system permease protein
MSKTMGEMTGLYLHYISASIRSQMQYRLSFALQSFGQVIVCGIDFVAIWAMFARFGSLAGWHLAEVALFYGTVNVAFALADATSRGFDMFPNMVRRGDFDRLLLRPRSTAFQLAAQSLELRRVGRLSQALAVLIYALCATHVAWSAAKVALLLAAIAGGACLFYGLIVLQATAAFWTIESLEVVNTVTYGGTETGSYPMSIYNEWFRRFFTYIVPLACVSYYPILAILGHGEDPAGGGAVPVFGWFSPAVGVVFLVVSLRVWRLGVRHYRSTGS